MTTAHALLSASGSAQWLNCAGSIRMGRDYPNESSPFAQEGTAAHALGEHCLKENVIDVSSIFGSWIYKEKLYPPDHVFPAKLDPKNPIHAVTEEMADAIQQYVDLVRSYKGQLFVERRVDFSAWVQDGFGTADAIVISDGVATVIDLKYGQGVRVDAFWNSQAMLYMLGVFAEYGMLYEIKKFKAVISQPRLDHVSEFEITREDLIAWAEKEVRPKALLALTDDAPLTAGEKQCRWCKARGDCSVLAEWSLEKAMEGFDFIEPEMKTVNTDKLTADQIATLLPHIPLIIKWCKAVEDSALTRLTNGDEVKGYKRVRSSTNRRWIDEQRATEALSETVDISQITTTKLLSPSQIEKVIGKGNSILDDLIERPEGKPTVAPEYDKRPAMEDPLAGFDLPN